MADISSQNTQTAALEQQRDPEIHVMPEKFLGVAAHAVLPPVARPAPQPSMMPASVAPVTAEQHGPARGLLLAAAGLVLVLGVIALAVWYPRTKKATPLAVQPPVNRNTNTSPPVVRTPATSTPMIATSTPAVVATTTPPVAVTPVRNATDRDADGLTDVEEREIYGTDPASADTDVDGYLDGGEVFYLYNPAAIAPVTLRESGIVRVVDEPSVGVSTLLPLPWMRRSLADGVVFTGATGEFIQITTEANPLGLSLSAWYQQHAAQGATGAPLAFTNRLGAVGIKTVDGLTAYFANGTQVVVVSYGTAGSREISYRRTFEMVLNSVALTPSTTPAAVIAPTNASSSAVTASGTVSTVPVLNNASTTNGVASGTP